LEEEKRLSAFLSCEKHELQCTSKNLTWTMSQTHSTHKTTGWSSLKHSPDSAHACLRATFPANARDPHSQDLSIASRACGGRHRQSIDGLTARSTFQKSRDFLPKRKKFATTCALRTTLTISQITKRATLGSGAALQELL